LDLDESGEVSVEVSLLGAFSVLASVFFVVLLVESAVAASVFVDSALLFFFVDGLVAFSAAGLLAVAGLFVDLAAGDGVVAGTGVGDAFVLLTLALADGVMVAAADAAGVMVAPTLAVAAGVALALVEAVTPVVVPLVVVPDVEVTPTLKLGVTP
jgi:hypothetical protein